MKTFSFKPIFYLVFAVLFCSCNHYYYAPEDGHLLALSEKEDIKVSVGGGSTDDDGNNSSGENFTLQAGYSPIRHLGIQGSYFTLNRSSSDANESNNRGNGFITSAAIGTYYFFENDRQRKKRKNKEAPVQQLSHLMMKKGFLVDFYSGYGFGKVHNFYSNGSASHLNFKKMYVQLGVHVKGKYTGAGYTVKLVRLDYEKAVLNGKFEEDELSNIHNIVRYNPFSMVENSLHFYCGVRQIRLFINMNFINDSSSNLKFINSTINAGVILELDEILKKRN